MYCISVEKFYFNTSYYAEKIGTGKYDKFLKRVYGIRRDRRFLTTIFVFLNWITRVSVYIERSTTVIVCVRLALEIIESITHIDYCIFKHKALQS